MRGASLDVTSDPQTPTQIARVLLESYPSVSGVFRLFIHLRPYICPFEKLLATMPASSSYLDVGCGIGLMSVLLARGKAATRIVGFDTSAQAIAIARAARFPETTKATFHLLAADAAWPSERVDNIVCIDVLHHVPRDRQREFISLLARANFTGTIFFKDVSPRPMWKSWGSHFHDLIVARERIHIRAEEEVVRWFEEEGFSVSGPTRMDVLWYTHYVLTATRPTRSTEASR